jgi:hypothetical protein
MFLVIIFLVLTIFKPTIIFNNFLTINFLSYLLIKPLIINFLKQNILGYRSWASPSIASSLQAEQLRYIYLNSDLFLKIDFSYLTPYWISHFCYSKSYGKYDRR